jgi:hypothetical protein
MDRIGRWPAIAAAIAAMVLNAAPAFAADYDDRLHEGYAVDRAFDERDVAIALAEQGFVEWDDIEWKKGVWRIDDARRVDGREYDLRLDPATLAVIWSDRD